MRSYFKINGAQLSRQVGTDSESGMRISDGREGHLCHGPYISLPAGRYTAAFFVRRQNPLLTGTITMDVCARHGDIILAKGHVQSDEIFHDVASFLKLDFDSSEDLDNVEVRMFVEGGMLIEVSELLIYRRTAREWGVQ